MFHEEFKRVLARYLKQPIIIFMDELDEPILPTAQRSVTKSIISIDRSISIPVEHEWDPNETALFEFHWCDNLCIEPLK